VVDVTQLEKLWHKGPDFTKDGAAIPLIFRVATVRSCLLGRRYVD
jgi:hypothetical protein